LLGQPLHTGHFIARAISRIKGDQGLQPRNYTWFIDDHAKKPFRSSYLCQTAWDFNQLQWFL